MQECDGKLQTETDTLRRLAAEMGSKRLIDVMMESGLSYFTASQMIRGKYKKALREMTQISLLRVLGPYGATAENLFRRVGARRKTA